ncbi:SAM-dependent methyltransferase [Ferroplasma acidiphilum]|uniref:Ribosomal RNA large subunit methyltransferase E n=2 Tax=Ferroplasma TaxID=74968 RepID=S0AQL7_FERAC|nr:MULTISPECIES: RlmE family RNA methyltransferase [Ferroplasma]AGO61067.1 FtsJ-like protein methyltransferase [Ferroplasma acidarmanus Fer1]NOL60382.1 RlmE family RNA methyltransferase [Ferroplasma acidiphilum]
MNRKDRYYTRAKKDNFRSRASYKLLEIQSKFNVIWKTDYVIEFGSSPGGWTQVVQKLTEKPVIAIDISPMDPIENVTFVQGNINDPELSEKIKIAMDSLGISSVSTVLSDAMIKTSGNYDRDHMGSYLLCDNVMNLSIDLLSSGGNVVLKQFQGDSTMAFVNKWKVYFNYYKVTKPNASRQHSREVYIIFKDKI